MDEKVYEGKLVYGRLNAHCFMPDYLFHRSPQIPSRMLPQAQDISANRCLQGIRQDIFPPEDLRSDRSARTSSRSGHSRTRRHGY